MRYYIVMYLEEFCVYHAYMRIQLRRWHWGLPDLTIMHTWSSLPTIAVSLHASTTCAIGQYCANTCCAWRQESASKRACSSIV